MNRAFVCTVTLRLAVAVAVLGIQCAAAETLTERVMDTRLVLAFKVDPAELQKMIPGPWEVAGTPAGLAKGANLNVIFYDRLVQQNGSGEPMGRPYRFVVFAPVVKLTESGAIASVVSRIVVSDASRTPGPYKNSVPGKVQRRVSVQTIGSNSSTVDEAWHVHVAPDDELSVALKYETSAPSRQKSEGRVYSAAEPAFYRIYRWDLGADPAKSGPSGIDRTKEYRFTISMPGYGPLLTNGELVAIIAQPVYVRDVYLP